MLCRLHCAPIIMLMVGFTERVHYPVPTPQCFDDLWQEADNLCGRIPQELFRVAVTQR